MQLNVKAFAMAAGALCGVGLAAITLVAAVRGFGLILSHLWAIFPGYQVTYLGSLIGLVYGFVFGVIVGGLFAAIYNRCMPAKS
jgi:hypothetical protein